MTQSLATDRLMMTDGASQNGTSDYGGGGGSLGVDNTFLRKANDLTATPPNESITAKWAAPFMGLMVEPDDIYHSLTFDIPVIKYRSLEIVLMLLDFVFLINITVSIIKKVDTEIKRVV